MATKRALSEKKRPSSQSRLVYEVPHVFRMKSAQSLSHLQENRDFTPCIACSKETDRREDTHIRPQTSYARKRSTPPPVSTSYSKQRPSTATKKKPLPPTQADLERLSRPKTASTEQVSDNCNWNNFIKKKSKYAIRTPYAECDLSYANENSEHRPPFVNYGGRYEDKQTGQKRTFNSLAIHQLKHHQIDEQRLAEVLRERRLRRQAENYFREMEERKMLAQELRDRAARSSTEYRDNYRPPQDYYGEGTFCRH